MNAPEERQRAATSETNRRSTEAILKSSLRMVEEMEKQMKDAEDLFRRLKETKA